LFWSLLYCIFPFLNFKFAFACLILLYFITGLWIFLLHLTVWIVAVETLFVRVAVDCQIELHVLRLLFIAFPFACAFPVEHWSHNPGWTLEKLQILLQLNFWIVSFSCFLVSALNSVSFFFLVWIFLHLIQYSVF
jgi:hypothetical protein